MALEGPGRCSVNMPMYFFKARSIACRSVSKLLLKIVNVSCVNHMFLVGAWDTGL